MPIVGEAGIGKSRLVTELKQLALAPDSDQSTLVAADGTAVADNVDTELLTVTLLEADGTTPVPGHSVILAISAGGSAGVTIGPPSGPSDANGIVTFTVRSSISKVVTFQAIDITDAIVITQTADVDFTPNVTDADNSTVVADDGTAVANGVETELITVTLLNGLGNPVFGHDVALAVIAGGAANVTISAPSGPSDSNGLVTFCTSFTMGPITSEIKDPRSRPTFRNSTTCRPSVRAVPRSLISTRVAVSTSPKPHWR